MPDDLPALKTIIESTGLFPPALLDEMTANYFSGKNTTDHWVTYLAGQPVAVAYFAP